MNWLRSSMSKVMLRVILPCSEITRLASESLDRNLSLPERLRLRAHYLICMFCQRYGKQIGFLRSALRTHPDRLESQEIPPPRGLSPEIRDRMKRALTTATD